MTAPKRRWFRFSLRMLFGITTFIGCWLGMVSLLHAWIVSVIGARAAGPLWEYVATGSLGAVPGITFWIWAAVKSKRPTHC
jgi:hypothetical protein